MTETPPLQGLGQLSPFFEKISAFDEPKDNQKTDEMIGKSSNRALTEKWNIKIQIGADFFTEIFAFIRELGFNTVIGLTSKRVRLYKLSADTTHLTYITIDKTEMSEYINTDSMTALLINENKNSEAQPETENETVIYVEFDMLDELSFNNKYPVDIYFDTKVLNKMYIVNEKAIESRRLNDTSTKNDPSLNTYKMYYDKILEFIKNENMVDLTVSHTAFSNVLGRLEKKKSKKDKSSSGILKVKFGTSEIDFLMSNEIKSSSIQMYGDDIAIRAEREANVTLQVDFLVKFKKLKLMNNVKIHVNENLPFIIETKFGAGNIKLFYLVSPRVETE